MKPVALDSRTGKLTLEQYLGLADGMSFKVAGRMLTLAGDYTNDVIGLHEDALDPRLRRGSLTSLARAATRAETHLARLLVLAAEHCREPELADVPLAIRSNMKTRQPLSQRDLRARDGRRAARPRRAARRVAGRALRAAARRNAGAPRAPRARCAEAYDRLRSTL